MNVNENDLINNIIFRKFKILKIIEKGNYSKVFLGNNLINNKFVALKFQEKKQLPECLEKEAYYLFQLKGIGIPKILSYGHYGKYNVLIEELLGKSLEQLFKENQKESKIIKLKDMLMTGIQILDRLKFIHSKCILHLDIKPNNFLVGNPDSSIIYLIDFGFAKKYRSSRTGKHVHFSKNSYFSGNLKYSSTNTMKGIEPSRRDDLESLGYMLIYLYNHDLPWDTMVAKNKYELAKKIYDLKNIIPIKILCKNLPIEIQKYMKYVKSLKFEEEPNYNYLTQLLEKSLQKINKVNDLNFSWIHETLRNNISYINSKNIRKSKTSPFSRILKAINTKSVFEEMISEKSMQNNLQINSNKEMMPFNNQIYKNITSPNKKNSHSSKCSPGKKIILNSGKNEEIKNGKKNKQIFNYNLFSKYPKYLSTSTKNIKNILQNKIIQTDKCFVKYNNIFINRIINKLNGRNNSLKFSFIVGPIISNKTINIYSNDSKKLNINFNKTNYEQNYYSKENDKLKTFNYIKKKYIKRNFTDKNSKKILLSNVRLSKNYNTETHKKLDSFLYSDIIYNRKFKKE